MEKLKLPQKIDPIRCAQRGASYRASIAREKLERLEAATQGLQSDVLVELTFGYAPRHRTLIHLDVSVEVMLQCQRCNESYSYRLAIVDACFLVVRSMEQDIPEDLEPIETDEAGEIDLFEFVEDELLLRLPLVPRHEGIQCATESMSWGNIEKLEEDKPNPFAVLESLKRNN